MCFSSLVEIQFIFEHLHIGGGGGDGGGIPVTRASNVMGRRLDLKKTNVLPPPAVFSCGNRNEYKWRHLVAKF